MFSFISQHFQSSVGTFKMDIQFSSFDNLSLCYFQSNMGFLFTHTAWQLFWNQGCNIRCIHCHCVLLFPLEFLELYLDIVLELILNASSKYLTVVASSAAIMTSQADVLSNYNKVDYNGCNYSNHNCYTAFISIKTYFKGP